MTKLILLNNNKEITIDEKYGISLEGNIQDIRDLIKVSGTNSKSLFITGNNDVNAIFGSLFNINFESQTFDITAKQECELWHNNEILIRGYFQIANIDYMTEGQYTYEIWVFDEQINFFLEIEENLIYGNDDETKDLDFSQYNHIWNYENIENSWNKDAFEQPYFYPIFNQSNSHIVPVEVFKPAFYLYNIVEQIFYKYGYQLKSDFLKSDFFRDIVLPFSTGDNVPVISDDEIEDRSFEANNNECSTIQNSYNSNELLTPSMRFPNFMGWTIPNQGHQFLPVEEPKQRQFVPLNNVIFEGTVGLVTPGLCTNTPLNFTQIPRFSAPVNNYTICDLQIQLDLNVKLRKYDLYTIITQNNQFGGDNNFYVRVELLRINSYSNFLGTAGHIVNYPPIFNAPTYFTTIQEKVVNLGAITSMGAVLNETRNFITQLQFEDVEFEPNVEYAITYSLQRNIWAIDVLPTPVVTFTVDQTVEINNSSNTIIKNIVKKSEVREGDEIQINSWLPHNLKQKELLKDVFKMFNLKMMPDPDNYKTLIVEPRDEFYSSGDVIDANNDDNFYVINKKSNYKLVTDFQAKEIIFKYADDSDNDEKDYGKILLLDYKNEFKRTYGEQRILFNNENLRNTRIINLGFASTILAENTAQPWENSSNEIQQKRYVTSMIESENPKNLPRILFKNIIPLNEGITESQGNEPFQIREFATSTPNTTYQDIPVKQTALPVVATATHFRGNPFNPTFDLNFGRCSKYYFKPETLTDSNLYTIFWQNEISNIDSQKMLTASFYISNNKFKNLKYNTIIYINKNNYTNYYIINKIIEYNAKTGEAKLELITFNPELTFKFNKIDLPIAFPADTLPVDLAGNPNPGVVIGTGNIIRDTGLTIGNNNTINGIGNIVSGPDNIVVGSGNIVSGTNNKITGRKSNVMGNNNQIETSAPVMAVGNDIFYNDDVPAYLVGNTVVINEDSIFYNGVDVLNQTIITITTDFTITDENYILCNQTLPIDITLPVAVNGRLVTIKDISGTAKTNFIYIIGTIDGQTNYRIQTDYESVKLISDGTSWFII